MWLGELGEGWTPVSSVLWAAGGGGGVPPHPSYLTVGQGGRIQGWGLDRGHSWVGELSRVPEPPSWRGPRGIPALSL